tara:strand:- start:335 stop:1006 length:672 start_codon:yes stop_codon:yes gene_type:complete
MALTRLGPNNSTNISGINLTSQVTGTLPIANGGTAATTAAALANTGNLVLIKTQTASAASSVEFINGSSDVVYDSTYKQYVLKIVNATASANSEMYLRFRTSSSFQTTNYYRSYFIQRTNNTTTQSSATNDGTYGIRLEHNYTGQAPSASNFEIILPDPSSTSLHKSVVWNCWGSNQESTTKVMQLDGVGFYSTNSSDAITGVGLFPRTGTLYGTYSLYGVKT